MKAVRFLEGDFEIVLKAYNAHSERINNLISQWNNLESLGVEPANAKVFEAIVTNDPNVAYPVFEATMTKILEKQTKVKEIQNLMRPSIKTAFDGWAEMVGKIPKLSDLIIWRPLLKERFLFDEAKGAVTIDVDAIREDFTIYMSPKGEELHALALEALEKLNQMNAFLEENGKDLRNFQIIHDNAPARSAMGMLAGGYSTTVERCFTNNEGTIMIDEDFFVNI